MRYSYYGRLTASTSLDVLLVNYNLKLVAKILNLKIIFEKNSTGRRTKGHKDVIIRDSTTYLKKMPNL